MAPPDPAQVTSVRSSSIANRTENPMTNRRGPPIGPNTSIKLDENIFRLVKRFSNLPAHLHAAEAITVENVRNSWFPMMEQLKRQFPEAFPTETRVNITGNDHPIFQTLRNLWPEREQFETNDRTIIIEFIIRSATEIGGRRTIRRNAARAAEINAARDENGERQPRPLDFDSIDDRENACRAYLFNKYSGLLNTLNNFYTSSKSAPTVPPVPKEMPVSQQKRKTREPTEEPENKKQKMKEDEELPEDETCQICFSERKTHAFIHAIQPSSAHFICCESCANQCNYATSGCPLCRLPVVAISKIL